MNAVLKAVKSREIQVPISNSPTIPHADCDTCEYLGNSLYMGTLFELYYHDSSSDTLKTFIARTGKDEKYVSGLEGITRHPMLALAFTRKIVGDYN
jgi:hypothetical protein